MYDIILVSYDIVMLLSKYIK